MSYNHSGGDTSDPFEYTAPEDPQTIESSVNKNQLIEQDDVLPDNIVFKYTAGVLQQDIDYICNTYKKPIHRLDGADAYERRAFVEWLAQIIPSIRDSLRVFANSARELSNTLAY